MANLLNLVPMKSPETISEVPEAVRASWATATSDQDQAKWVKRRAANDNNVKGLHDWADKVVSETDQAVEDLCWSTFNKEKQLPAPMKERASSLLTKMMVTPRASLLDILEVTQKLGFVILPFEYVDPVAWRSEDEGTQRAIHEFGRLGGGTETIRKDYLDKTITHPTRMDVYVVCPPIYYSLDKHINAADPNKAIFAGKNDQAFMALSLTLPTLRAMKTQIEVLEQNQQTLNADYSRTRNVVQQTVLSTSGLKKQVDELRTSVVAQLGRMQEMIDGEIRSTAEAALRTATSLDSRASKEDKTEAQRIIDSLGSKISLKDTREALNALEAIRFRIEEPLMFALERGTALRDRGAKAALGPCWGPDFADIIATAVGLHPDKQLREDAEKMLHVWRPAKVARDSYGERSTFYSSTRAF